jgi:uncharacterized membrane protein (DUF485 family)
LSKKKSHKKKHRTSTETNAPQVTFQSASVALPTMADEYTKERERTSILDNKSISLITVLIALLTVYIPLIPFETIYSTYLNGSKNEFALVFFAVLMLITSFVVTAISFTKLIKTIKLQEYRKADIDMICKEEYLKCDKDVMEKALCEHYKELIHYNSKINEDKVKNLSGCFGMVSIIFFLLLISTVILKIVN